MAGGVLVVGKPASNKVGSSAWQVSTCWGMVAADASIMIIDILN